MIYLMNFLAKFFRSTKLQKFKKTTALRSRDFQTLQDGLPANMCIDVGASYFPHTPWWFFLGSRSTKWLAVDPNIKNLGYHDNWPWSSEIEVIGRGLSEFGGLATLYKTNTDSGSSILKPVFRNDFGHRHDESVFDYFFPVREIEIETISLRDLIVDRELVPTFVKLDTQGSELSILKGALNNSSGKSILAIEVECSLLAVPNYEDSPRLWDVALYLESKGFEVLSLVIIPRIKTFRISRFRSKKISRECDAIFALRREIALSLSIEYRACLLGFYISNEFYGEALALFDLDIELHDYLRSRAVDTARIKDVLSKRAR
jgi:FkbM family methyltransferase